MVEQINHMSGQQKNLKKVMFEEEDGSHTQKALKTISRLFTSHCLAPPQLDSDPKIHSLSNITRQQPLPKGSTAKKLHSLKATLARQLLEIQQFLPGQVFEHDLDPAVQENRLTALTLFGYLLGTESIGPDNCFRVLRWTYDLVALNPMDLSIELSNLLASVKKKLVRLGTSLLGNGGQEQQDQQAFKKAFTGLVEEKEKQIEELQYQLCRVCQSYQPIDTISFHVEQCERKHQKKYLENKLRQKGNILLNELNSMPQDSEEYYDLNIFFKQVFRDLGGKLATFALRNNREQVLSVVQHYSDSEYSEMETYCEIIEMLEKYGEVLGQRDIETTSDKDSYELSRSNLVIDIDLASVEKLSRRSSILSHHPSCEDSINVLRRGSATSLLPESMASMQLNSDKTINSETETDNKLSTNSLKDFEILSKIGKGAFSEVYLVRKKKTKDLFAMKVLETGNLSEDTLAAFKKEMRVYRSIQGGYNVKLYYSFAEGDLYCFILDFASGGNFRDLLERETYLEEEDVKVYLANLVLAVQSIHDLGILHRDLKPQNLVINEEGHLVLTDFNLSKMVKDHEQTKPGQFFGTPDYIAPEVLRGEEHGTMIDWFSVGVIAYQMTLGARPFGGDSPQQVFDNILSGEVVWPDEDGISHECRDLIQCFFNPDPKKRLGSNGIGEIQSHPFFAGIDWDHLEDLNFFYKPDPVPSYSEDSQLLSELESKKSQEMSIKLISSNSLTDSIVRYDILKTATTTKVRSHRNSRFKLEKELEALKVLPGQENHPTTISSFRNATSFRNFSDDSIRSSGKMSLKYVAGDIPEQASEL